MSETFENVPADAVGMRLYRVTKNDLIACEAVRFTEGRAAVIRTILLARVSGRGEVGGKIENHFADILNDDQDIVETVALSAKSYRSLKTRWMKCKLEPRL